VGTRVPIDGGVEGFRDFWEGKVVRHH
jgi:hypothetical protein